MICYTICRISEFEITIVEKEGKIIQASFGSCGMPEWTEKKTNLLAEAERQLREYFCGERREFQLPLVPEGTAFQQKVWKALQTIPYGETRSYKEIAIETKDMKNFSFIWITDGKGWLSSKNNLQDTFNSINHLYNLKDVENGLFKKL